jgi:hypothetical protein
MFMHYAEVCLTGLLSGMAGALVCLFLIYISTKGK